MVGVKTCEGCPNLFVEDACRGYLFFGCSLGKFDYPKGIFEHARADLQNKPSVPIPAWCKLGKGYKWA